MKKLACVVALVGLFVFPKAVAVVVIVAAGIGMVALAISPAFARSL